MASIKSKNTSIDNKIASLLRKAKIRFARYPRMLGNPDFVIKSKKVIIFCDGDFWHGYDYKQRKAKLTKFWKEKIEANKKRDKKNNRYLIAMGWKVLRIWEHDINLNSEKVY
ncbi:MAG: very short patch repair endonuclease, partial [Candidatus Omnitrophica bacterium]|nr:very short patch repair endonuclease [Candidatus Omnitrophota bacterium]